VAAAGGKLIVSPNRVAEVITESKRLDLVSDPDTATPTEDFATLAAGSCPIGSMRAAIRKGCPF
jgi:2-dehydro-3-deoxyphosphogalactonate aldolase